MRAHDVLPHDPGQDGAEEAARMASPLDAPGGGGGVEWEQEGAPDPMDSFEDPSSGGAPEPDRELSPADADEDEEFDPRFSI